MRFRAILGPPAILALLWTAVIWWPSQSSVSSANDSLDDNRSQQLSLFSEIDRLNETILRLPGIERDLDDIAGLITAETDVDAFLDTVAEAADSSGVLINLISPTEVLDISTADASRPVPPGVEAVAFILEAEGEFANVMAFIDRLDELPRLVVVDQVSMVAVEGETQSIVLDMSLRIFSGGVASQAAALPAPIDISDDPAVEDPVQNTEGDENP